MMAIRVQRLAYASKRRQLLDVVDEGPPKRQVCRFIPHLPT